MNIHTKELGSRGKKGMNLKACIISEFLSKGGQLKTCGAYVLQTTIIRVLVSIAFPFPREN